MSKHRYTKSISNIKCFTPSEIEENKQRYYLRNQLGLLPDYDNYCAESYEDCVKTFLKISTHYKSINDYELDKAKASILITENKPIPADLYNRLLQTKEELEKANILYKI